tara:strand:+ start:761 stop:1099 length:339 start_codon:yes stop_codon:yes gene_type:complete
MKNYSRKKPKVKAASNIQKKIIRAVLLFGFLALLITFFFGDHGLYHLYTLRAERNKVQKEIDYLRNQKITLEDEKTRLKTDYKYIEEMAREKYRMAKKGEKVFKVIEEKEEN